MPREVPLRRSDVPSLQVFTTATETARGGGRKSTAPPDSRERRGGVGQVPGLVRGRGLKKARPHRDPPLWVWLCRERRSVVQQTKGLMRSGPSGF